jgi:hypothetical protein
MYEEKEDIQKDNTTTTYHSPHTAETQKEIYSGDESIGNAIVSGFLWVIIILLIFIVFAGILMKPTY